MSMREARSAGTNAAMAGRAARSIRNLPSGTGRMRRDAVWRPHGMASFYMSVLYERGYGMANLELGADHAHIAVYGGVDLGTDDGDEHSAPGGGRQVVDG